VIRQKHAEQLLLGSFGQRVELGKVLLVPLQLPEGSFLNEFLRLQKNLRFSSVGT
jgi:hypothetical protein